MRAGERVRQPTARRYAAPCDARDPRPVRLHGQHLPLADRRGRHARRSCAEAGLTDEIEIDSAGTGGWHAGAPPDARSPRPPRRAGSRSTGGARQVTAGGLRATSTCCSRWTAANVRDLLRLAPDARAAREGAPAARVRSRAAVRRRRPRRAGPLLRRRATASSTCSTSSTRRAAACSTSCASGRRVRDALARRSARPRRRAVRARSPAATSTRPTRAELADGARACSSRPRPTPRPGAYARRGGAGCAGWPRPARCPCAVLAVRRRARRAALPRAGVDRAAAARDAGADARSAAGLAALHAAGAPRVRARRRTTLRRSAPLRRCRTTPAPRLAARSTPTRPARAARADGRRPRRAARRRRARRRARRARGSTTSPARRSRPRACTATCGAATS